MPEKMNGYFLKEVKELIAFLQEGKKSGKTLSALFAQYGKKAGRAAGSVRNFYYKLLKTEHKEVQELLQKSALHAEEIVPFTEEEVDAMLLAILQEKAKGYSIRRAILNITEGDGKKMLRYQNKYRNLLRDEPDRIAKMAKEVGVTWREGRVYKQRQMHRRLQEELTALYSKIAEGFQFENERLKESLLQLEAENAELKNQSKVVNILQKDTNSIAK